MEVTRRDQKHYWAWSNLGGCHSELREFRAAVECYGTCLGLASDPATTYYARYHRGLAYRLLGDFDAAAGDLKAAIACLPRLPVGLMSAERPKAYVLLADILTDRGKLFSRQADLAEAETVLTDGLTVGGAPIQLYLRRGEVRSLRKDSTGARRDWDAMLKIDPTRPLDWTFRGLAHLDKADYRTALADFDRALALDPQNYLALQNKAHVLSEHLGKDDESLGVLTQIIDHYPDYVRARIGRAVLLARQGKRLEAHADAAAALARAFDGETLYMAANVYALTSKQVPSDADRVYPLLGAALINGFGFDDVGTDADMAAVRGDPRYRQIVDASRKIRADLMGQQKAN